MFSRLCLVAVAFAVCAVAQDGHSRILWDNHPETPQAKIARGNLNPYNSIRPEYRDAPPSHSDLEKIWQHHLQDHVYKSPFVRPMKSGLWESGVPNRYAPGGYNRRKFKTEEEALLYVRHKTGAGMDVDYAAAKHSEKGSFLEVSSKNKDEDEDDEDEDGKPKKKGKKEEKKKDKKEEKKKDTKEEKKPEHHHEENNASDPEKLENEEENLEKKAEEQLDHTAEEQEIRDHNLKIAHKIREFLANYNPNKPIHVVKGYGSR